MDDFYDIKKSIAFAELNICGINISYNELTNLLGLETYVICTSGDNSAFWESGVIISPEKKENQQYLWTYKTANKYTYDLIDQIEDIRLLFKDKIHIINELQMSYPDCEINVCVVLYNYQTYLPGITISIDQLLFLAKLNASYDLHFNLNPKSYLQANRAHSTINILWYNQHHIDNENKHYKIFRHIGDINW